jgi:transcriptional regulator
VFSAELKKGSVELLVLSLLEHEQRHGYDIGKLIEQRSGGRLRFQVSSLYPVLARMEERGWIRGRWVEQPGQRRRRYYRLSESGRQALARKKETWRAYSRAVNRVTGVSHA